MSRFAMCPECGHRMRRNKDMFGNWDGETYICDYCAGEEDDDDEMDNTYCENCGNYDEWPGCKSFCGKFDD